MPPTPNKIWQDKETQKLSVKTQAFFVKTELKHI